MRISVLYLPSYAPEGEEATNGQLMADKVRGQMAKESGFPLHHLGSRELRKEMKEAAAKAELAKKAKSKGGGEGATDPLL